MDKITNKALVNLDNPSQLEITAHLNKVWGEGILLEDWKMAEVRLIPKKGKPPTVENLQPIYLTSCVRKLLDHIILNGLQLYLEDAGKLPTTMVGFRPHLSTQEILLQLEEEVMAPATRNFPIVLLALDLKETFDNVKPTTILEAEDIAMWGQDVLLHQISYHKVKPSKRSGIKPRATFKSEVAAQQGKVLYRLLFNIALIGLPTLLNNIPGIRHSRYADDFIIWSSTGSIGAMESKKRLTSRSG